jgi:hypothetical protein
MLKIIGRIAVILLVSVAIGAAIYWGVQHRTGAGEQNVVEGSAFRSGAEGFAGPQAGVERLQGREHDLGGRPAAGHAVLGIVKNLVVIAMITLVVTLIQKMSRRVRRGRLA